MGTTLTALQSDDGVGLAFTLAIAGYEYILTDGDASAAVTAWAGTDWSAALSGLRIDGRFSQSITPWSDKLDVGRLTFYVSDASGDDSDTFGIDTHKAAAGNETYLDEDLTPNDTTISVVSTGAFASSGTIYIGTERIEYAGKTTSPDTFTGCTRGSLSPVGTSSASDVFGQEHNLPQYDYDTAGKIVVSDQPRKWIGRIVALYVHRVVAGVLDVRAQAQRIFTGRIKDIADTSSGETAVVCEDLRCMVRDCVLMRDQFRGRVKEGLYINQGARRFDAYVVYGTNPVTAPATQLELAAGWYTAEQLCNELQEWLIDDGAIGEGAAITDGWSVIINDDDRVVITWEPAAGTTAPRGFAIWNDDDGLYDLGMIDWDHRTDKLYSNLTSGDPSITGPMAYIRAKAFQITESQLQLDSSTGSWFNNADWLPENLRDHIGTSEDWGLLQIGGSVVVLAKHDTDTNFTDIALTRDHHLTKLFGERGELDTEIRADMDGDLEVRQIVLINGEFESIVPRLFATTGASSGYNHATYDETDWGSQFGAGIPWDCLGDAFEDSIINDLNETSAANSMMVYLEKPTRLSVVLAPELILRGAHLVWKNGVMYFTTSQTPLASLADHALTEDNKALPSETRDPNRSPAIRDVSHCRNVIKLEYNRDIRGNYRSHVVVKHEESIGMIGERPLTIKCRNTFGDYNETGASVHQLIADVIGYVLPTWAMPLPRIRRTVDMAFYEDVAPGDQVTVTDSFARDTDGTRGVTSRAGVILKHAYDFGAHGGEMNGEVEITFTDLNFAIYCPTGRIDETADGGAWDKGYNNGATTIRLKEHEYSESSEAVDASHFAANDTLTILEIDPADPAAATSILDTGGNEPEVDSVSSNDLVLKVALAGWDNTLIYQVYSDNYGDAQASQQSDCYQADDADMSIEDTASPYLYGHFSEDLTITAAAPTHLAERYADDHSGDGVALATGFHRQVARNINNFLVYKSAPQMPSCVWDGYNSQGYYQGPVGVAWYHLFTVPAPVGAFKHVLGGLTRKWSTAPSIESTTTDDEVGCRITLSLNPPTGSSHTSVSFSMPYVQLTYTTTSTDLVIATAQQSGPIVKPWSGRGYLTVELNGSGGHGSSVLFWGIGELHMDPLG
jgi:hypothetical protein